MQIKSNIIDSIHYIDFITFNISTLFFFLICLVEHCSTLPLIHALYCRVLSMEVSSTIFKVFGMTQPGIEPRSPGPLANTLPTTPMIWLKQYQCSKSQFVNTVQIHLKHYLKQIDLRHRWDPNKYYDPGSEWTWE